jgi:lipopolysaccharide transport system ATP-binding protein
MFKPLAINFKNVSKIYKLHGSQSGQIIDVLGLHRLGIRPKTPFKEFIALNNISLEVPRGRRVGIVGRNGAGKTTLLKLICGNYAPTLGDVVVNGVVQALMNIGLGFHPEYTGRENVEASLLYNGLSKSEYQNALDGIIEFCELGDFMDQPFKTYSLGMQARLMFAASTAINPDILIVDEVLGAGDAYFVAKSKTRVERLISTGCTMLLVSHSMQQILELCEEVIWLDKGSIRMQGEAFEVVKAYEEYIQNPIQTLSKTPNTHPLVIQLKEIENLELDDQRNIQDPRFIPFARTPFLTQNKKFEGFDHLAKGGVSRWRGTSFLKICGFNIEHEGGISNKVFALKQVKFNIAIKAEVDGGFNCRYGISIYNQSGQCVTNILSPKDSFNIKKGEVRSIVMDLNPCQLGTGEYVISVSVLEWAEIERLNSSVRHDLLSRSFLMVVEVPGTYSATDGVIYHNAEWSFGQCGIFK